MVYPREDESPGDESPGDEGMVDESDQENVEESHTSTDDDDGDDDGDDPEEEPMGVGKANVPAGSSVHEKSITQNPSSVLQVQDTSTSLSGDRSDSSSGSDTTRDTADQPDPAPRKQYKSEPSKSAEENVKSQKKRSRQQTPIKGIIQPSNILKNKVGIGKKRARKGAAGSEDEVREGLSGDESSKKKSALDDVADKHKQSSPVVGKDEDDRTLLKGLLEFNRSAKLDDPTSYTDGFVDYARGSLKLGLTEQQVLHKIRKLKKKHGRYASRVKNGMIFANPHDEELFRLSNAIWGIESGTETRAGDGELLCVSEAVRMNRMMVISIDENLIRTKMALLDKSKLSTFDERWKKINEAKANTFREELDLYHVQNQALLEFILD